MFDIIEFILGCVLAAVMIALGSIAALFLHKIIL